MFKILRIFVLIILILLMSQGLVLGQFEKATEYKRAVFDTLEVDLFLDLRADTVLSGYDTSGVPVDTIITTVGMEVSGLGIFDSINANFITVTTLNAIDTNSTGDSLDFRRGVFDTLDAISGTFTGTVTSDTLIITGPNTLGSDSTDAVLINGAMDFAGIGDTVGMAVGCLIYDSRRDTLWFHTNAGWAPVAGINTIP